jgi:hypothetical protein
VGTPQKGNGDHKNRSAAGGRDSLEEVLGISMNRFFPSNESLTSILVFEKYSVFTTTEKWFIVAMVSYATWFSGLSSFIYYPATHALSQSLSVPVDKINLAITFYLAVATVAPTLFDDLADVLDRRPVYLIILSNLSVYIAAILPSRYQSYIQLFSASEPYKLCKFPVCFLSWY